MIGKCADVLPILTAASNLYYCQPLLSERDFLYICMHVSTSDLGLTVQLALAFGVSYNEVSR